ncbi:MAG: hypothetical protein ABSB40_00060 [Nitrososphaeria archaeon]
MEKVRKNRADRIMDMIYRDRSLTEQISIRRRYRRYWFQDTAWRIKMRRKLVSSIESACFAAAYLASKLKDDSSEEMIYTNSRISDILSTMLSVYSEINSFSVEPAFNPSLPENLLIPLVLGFETNLEISRKDEIPFFGVSLLYRISEIRRKISLVYLVYCEKIGKKSSKLNLDNDSERKMLKRIIDRPSTLSLARWRRVCLKSLKQLDSDFNEAFGELRRGSNIYEKDLPSSLMSSISWFLSKKDVEYTVDVISKVPIAEEGSTEFQGMYG